MIAIHAAKWIKITVKHAHMSLFLRLYKQDLFSITVMSQCNVATSHLDKPDSPVLIRGGNRHMLIQPEYLEVISADSFVSDNWESMSRPVNNTGRGAAWFLTREEQDWTLRYYQRGGLMAHLNGNAHFYLGHSFVRSFSEFHLLNRMYHSGLPVPKPVAASFYKTGGLWYRAQIIMEKIPNAAPFSKYLLTDDEQLWMDVGRLIRHFHDNGIYHADLNCHNILVSNSSLYLIDFDKSGFKRGNYWKKSNLKRLRRSFEKLFRETQQEKMNNGWRQLMQGYGLSTYLRRQPEHALLVIIGAQTLHYITELGIY